MRRLVGVRYERSGPVQLCDPAGLDVKAGDRVLVDFGGERRPATVIIAPEQVLEADLPEDEALPRLVADDGR